MSAAYDHWDISIPDDEKLYARLNDVVCPIAHRTVADQAIEMAASRPDAVALELGDVTISYGELARRAAGVAIGLAAKGMRPGDICAIFLDKRLDLYPVLLGAHLAGLVVAPLDTTAPPARIERCLELVGARLLVTADDLTAQVPAVVPKVMCDDDWPMDEEFVNLASWSGGAYVMFTSGTTGLPKPVLVGHASLANLAWGIAKAFSVDQHSRVTHVAPVHFDPSWQQIASAWVSGASLLPVPDRVRADPALMSKWLTDKRVTHCSSVPSLWNPVVRYLAENPDVPRPLTLRVQGLGGEQLDAEYVRMWHDRVSSRTKIFNVYGPIEATVTATLHPIDGSETGLTIPIGRPLPNLRAYVLDDEMKPCPPGVIGQLFLGGDGLAVGYLPASRETAASFLPDPFTDQPGARMYATGDRVRLLLSGSISFEGRVDTMVKVRGVRIDLCDIEIAMRAAPGVDSAAAVVDPTGNLTGFFTSSSGVQAEILYQTLAAQLPPSSIPARLIPLPSLPVSSTGKVDR